MDRYKITGPCGEGPFIAEGESSREAIRCLTDAGVMPRYSIEQPRGPHGALIAYQPSGQPYVISKVGAFDISWVCPAAYEDHPLTVPA